MLKGYRFRPGWITTLATVALLPVLIGLGFWQLDRAEQKTAIRDQYLERGRLEPVDLNRQTLDARAMDFRNAVARGRYLPGFTIYLDNKVLDGTPGYQVLTPLAIQGTERVVLVNRGWTAWGQTRQELPRVDTPDGPVEVSGRLRAPPEDYFTLGDEAGETEFQRRWQNLDLERYRRVTGLAVATLVLQLDSGGRGGEGLVQQWPEYSDIWIDRHKGYAVQWFALALTLVVLYVVLNLTKRSKDSG
ncbi:MAG TPA: SURF1 family protein [Arenicellales bacterium]|nr:SURF1 family protein [Arenicellales bacterium]